MAGGIKVIRAIPGSTYLVPILRDFSKHGGIVTALDDSLLYSVRQLVDEDWPVEIEPFGKIVRDYLSLCGEHAPLLATAGSYHAAIGQACRRLEPNSPFHRASKFTGTHEALARTLDELGDYGIGVEELPACAERATPRLKSKLESLWQLLREATNGLGQLGRQVSDYHLRACLESIPERDEAFERLLILAHASIPPLKVKWLRWAAQHGTDITVVLDRHATGADLFQDADRTADALGTPGSAFGEGNLLLNNLFSQESFTGAPVQSETVVAADPLAEAEWAVRGCLESANPVIYVRNLDSYAPLIEASAKRLGAQVRVFRRAPVLTNSFARTTLAVLEFCAGNDVRLLEPVLKSSYLNLDPPSRLQVQGALREAHRGRAAKWEILESFARNNAEQLPWLPQLLAWRRKALAGPYPVREWLPILTELIRAEVFPWSTAQAEGNRTMRERDIRARNRMEQVLGDHLSFQHLQGSGALTLHEMASLCRELWSEADVSIPPSEHGIVVTDSSALIGNAGTLFVLGMLEGVFPRRRTEDPVLTDEERKEISELANVKLPNSHDRAREERDEFYRVCACAGNRIVFSYPSTDDQRDNIPAFYLEEIRRASGEGNWKRIEHPRPMLAPRLEDCANDVDLRLRAALDSPPEFPLGNVLSTLPAQQALLPSADRRFSPNELRDSLQCSFRFVARHMLGLHPQRQRARWASLRKLPQSSDLTSQPDAASAEKALMANLEQELDMMVAELPEWEIQLLQAGGRRLIQDWVKREFRARVKWPKNEGSIKRHARFGEALRDQMPGGVRLSGTVPAVSKLGTYNIAHLYGSAAPDDAELEDQERLYYGVHLLALHAQGQDSGLELETMSGKRILLVLGRTPGAALPSDHAAGLRVINLADADNISIARRDFFEGVKVLLHRAVANIRNGEITPRRGEHCVHCDYGELCRRSYYFSEEDSPFGEDLATLG